jgi:hypothetical protein
MSSQQNGWQITPETTRYWLFCVLSSAGIRNDLSIGRQRCMRDSFDGPECEAELAFLGSEKAEVRSAIFKDNISRSGRTHLLIMMLNLLTFFRSIGLASFFSFPR